MHCHRNSRATFIPDVQGSIVATLASSTGALTKTGYLPYGASSTTPVSFGYTAQRIDPETNGLYYYRARHYSPAWGRFIQPDPNGYDEGVNLYRYVGNDPLNLTDPFGLSPDLPVNYGNGYGANAQRAAGNLSAGNYGTAAYYELLHTADTFLAITPFGAAENALARGGSALATEGAGLTGTALARSLGQAGEDAVGIIGPKVSIEIPGSGQIRIPDALTESTLTEVKNVGSLSYTQQLRDFTTYSQTNRLDFQLYVRPSTQLSGPLQQAITKGQINLNFIPGTP